MKKTGKNFLIPLFAIGFVSNALGDECAKLDPAPNGPPLIVLDENQEYLKSIFVTQVVGIDFDDQDEINDALIDAEQKAKRTMAAFMKEKLTSDYVNKEVIKKSKTQSAEGSVVVKETLKTQLRDIATNVEKELVGVKSVDSCVDTNDRRRVGVTVVWSAKLAEVASDASVKMTQEAQRQTAAESSGSSSASSGSTSQRSSFSSSRDREKGLY